MLGTVLTDAVLHLHCKGGLGGLRKPLGREVATTAFYSPPTPTTPYYYTALMHTLFPHKLATTNPPHTVNCYNAL